MKGVDQVISRLAALPARADQQLEKAAVDCAREAEAKAREHAPLRTGALRASISATESDTGTAVYAAAPYAGIVEQGASRRPARPYLLPAAQASAFAARARQVETEAAALGHTAAAALSPHLPDDSGFVLPAPAAGPGREDTPLQINLTVPLEIDGYRLGVAAIEGIQQVQGGSGRIELDL